MYTDIRMPYIYDIYVYIITFANYFHNAFVAQTNYLSLLCMSIIQPQITESFLWSYNWCWLISTGCSSFSTRWVITIRCKTESLCLGTVHMCFHKLAQTPVFIRSSSWYLVIYTHSVTFTLCHWGIPIIDNKEKLFGQIRVSLKEPGGCFTNVSRALQNNLAKIYNARNDIYNENFMLKLCTCAQSMALGTRTKF